MKKFSLRLFEKETSEVVTKKMAQEEGRMVFERATGILINPVSARGEGIPEKIIDIIENAPRTINED